LPTRGTARVRPYLLRRYFTAVFITVAVQVLVLMVASAFIFDICWGEPLAVAVMALAVWRFKFE